MLLPASTMSSLAAMPTMSIVRRRLRIRPAYIWAVKSRIPMQSGAWISAGRITGVWTRLPPIKQSKERPGGLASNHSPMRWPQNASWPLHPVQAVTVKDRNEPSMLPDWMVRTCTGQKRPRCGLAVTQVRAGHGFNTSSIMRTCYTRCWFGTIIV
ncbi:hypothetical protein ES703_117552 [subsurface metagenome]